MTKLTQQELENELEEFLSWYRKPVQAEAEAELREMVRKSEGDYWIAWLARAEKTRAS
ncbi:hypothetical protein [Gilliamella sp. ESL0250]|uniref:hypothetical protein n=1 Tax=Gilliamella sp. ESL0250 TaxID=2705036 RepID=UPI001580F575|nr:hypothetical protein [Gilliamella sp. ESL0250]NUF49494.1 hypothetical protein [Gilliamella sp. ESL0250]